MRGEVGYVWGMERQRFEKRDESDSLSDCAQDAYSELTDRMSPLLKSEVVVKRTRWLEQVVYLRGMSKDFIVAIGNHLTAGVYCPQELISFGREGALAIVARGICSLQGHVKTPGTCWGEDFVLECEGLKDYRVSVGVGLRLYLAALGPAPLAFDFGFPIVKQETDQTQIFSFSAELPF